MKSKTVKLEKSELAHALGIACAHYRRQAQDLRNHQPVLGEQAEALARLLENLADRMEWSLKILAGASVLDSVLPSETCDGNHAAPPCRSFTCWRSPSPERLMRLSQGVSTLHRLTAVTMAVVKNCPAGLGPEGLSSIEYVPLDLNAEELVWLIDRAADARDGSSSETRSPKSDPETYPPDSHEFRHRMWLADLGNAIGVASQIPGIPGSGSVEEVRASAARRDLDGDWACFSAVVKNRLKSMYPPSPLRSL